MYLNGRVPFAPQAHVVAHCLKVRFLSVLNSFGSVRWEPLCEAGGEKGDVVF